MRIYRGESARFFLCAPVCYRGMVGHWDKWSKVVQIRLKTMYIKDLTWTTRAFLSGPGVAPQWPKRMTVAHKIARWGVGEGSPLDARRILRSPGGHRP